MPTSSIISGSRNSISRDARKALRIEGIKEIQENIGRVMNATTGKRVKRLAYGGGTMVRDRARQNAPYDPHRKRGTHVRDAIFVDEGSENKPNVLVGVRYRMPGGAPHAHLVEYGTSKMQAHPYFRPAIVQMAAQVAAYIKKGLLDIIEAALK